MGREQSSNLEHTVRAECSAFKSMLRSYATASNALGGGKYRFEVFHDHDIAHTYHGLRMYAAKFEFVAKLVDAVSVSRSRDGQNFIFEFNEKNL